MSAFLPGIPQPGEYNPAFGEYIGKAHSFPDPIQKLTEQLDEVCPCSVPSTRRSSFTATLRESGASRKCSATSPTPSA